MEIQIFEYVKNKKSFFDEIKTFFTVLEGVPFGEKVQNG